ncbi:hypothetical protein J1614_007676 [Plenodomus biglobosus]|nr:hypothetical protein J1614_007676 [Plenodomus biglobosus]
MSPILLTIPHDPASLGTPNQRYPVNERPPAEQPNYGGGYPTIEQAEPEPNYGGGYAANDQPETPTDNSDTTSEAPVAAAPADPPTDGYPFNSYDANPAPNTDDDAFTDGYPTNRKLWPYGREDEQSSAEDPAQPSATPDDTEGYVANGGAWPNWRRWMTAPVVRWR